MESFPDTPVNVNDETFDSFASSHPLILVDFWATWCHFCTIVSPIVEDLAAKYQGKVAFAKMDIDSNPKTAMRYGIMAAPTLLLLKNGEPVDQIVGAVPKAKIVSVLERHI